MLLAAICTTSLHAQDLGKRFEAGLQEKDYLRPQFQTEEEYNSLGVSTEVFAKDALPQSLWEWETIKQQEFLDFDRWKVDQDFKDKNPNWRNNWREVREREPVGRVMACVGKCRHYRGVGHSMAQFKSLILEGDEMVLENNSYAWIVLFDGTLVRLAPQTSVTFKEFNWSENTQFHFVRLNGGHMLWLPRSRQKITASDERETDGLFLPLKIPIPQHIEDDAKLASDDLLSLITREGINQSQYIPLNRNIVFNNQGLKQFKHQALIVFPNGSILSNDAAVEIISLRAGNAWFKWRQAGDTNNTENIIGDISFYYRGYTNTEVLKIESGQWHQIDPKGRQCQEDLEAEKRFGLVELSTKRIPSILHGRELMLERYSFSIYASHLNSDAAYYPYRRWSDIEVNGKQSEMQRRLAFLQEYTRREETTGLLNGQKFKEKMLAVGEVVPASEFGSHFFSDAMENYMANGQK